MLLKMNNKGAFFASVLLLQLFPVNCYSIFGELKPIDVAWETVDIDPTAPYTDIQCYKEISTDGINRTFKLDLGLAVRQKYACMIQLPTPSDLRITEMRFADPGTTARALTGNVRNRPVLGSVFLTRNSPRDDYGEFTVQCLYGFLVVAHPSPGDYIKFVVRPLEENAPIVTDEMCTKSHLKTRGERTSYDVYYR